MLPMPRTRRLIPLLAAVLVIQGLVGVLPHTHEIGGVGTEDGFSQAVGIVTPHGASDASHDCLACLVHAPDVESAADRGIVHGVVLAATAPVIRWSISILSNHKTANPRAPPRIV